MMPADNHSGSVMWFWVLGWFFTVLTIAGNGFVVYLILTTQSLRTRSNCFIVSLAVADTFVGLAYFPPIFVKSFKCRSPDCKDVIFITRHFFQYCSITNLCAMIVDRYIAIVKPLEHASIVTTLRVVFILIGIWTGPMIFFVIPQSIVISDENQDNVFSIIKTLMFNTIPMIVSIVLTTRVLAIARNLARESRALRAQVRFNYRNGALNITTEPNSKNFEREGTAKIMIIVMVIFILCSMAEHWKGFCSPDWNLCDISENIKHLLDLVCIINSAANPIAYSFLKKDFKTQLKRLFHNIR